MAYFDTFYKGDVSTITPMGRFAMRRENQWFVQCIERMTSAPHATLRVLEIGPGKGFFADACRSAGMAYRGVEGSDGMANDLRGRGFDVRTGFAPPIEGAERYDVIFLKNVFEHMRDKQQAWEMLASIREHLTRDGILVMSVPDILSWKSDFYADYDHSFPTSREGISRLLADADYEILYIAHHKYFLRGQALTRVVAFLARLAYSLGLFHLAFGKKSYKVLTSLFASVLLVSRIMPSESRTASGAGA